MFNSGLDGNLVSVWNLSVQSAVALRVCECDSSGSPWPEHSSAATPRHATRLSRSHVTFLCLDLPICRMGSIPPTSQGCCEDLEERCQTFLTCWWDDIHEIYTVWELNKSEHLVNCTRYWKRVFKRAFYQLKIVLISRVHGLIHFFFIVCTKELYGFIDFWHDACWCENERPERQRPGGWCSQTGRGHRHSPGQRLLGREHAQRAVNMHLVNSSRIGSKLMQTMLS